MDCNLNREGRTVSQDHTKEKQYQIMLEYRRKRGLESMGLMASQAWYDDPKRLAFTLARYKFVAKMLSGFEHVLEVGCADAFGTRVVVQEVKKLTAVDFDALFVEDTNARMSDRWKFECRVHDMLAGPVTGKFDGAYALDVLEHIAAEKEEVFLRNMAAPLGANGVMIIGMPSLESQPYASPLSKEGHVNCKTRPDLKALMQRFFNNVFMFSMNDEVVHTGYHKMAHYLFALCCGKK
jgi:cyclopropane fatty-acyl-phospholipid synthase-like methyltransferase